MKLLLVLIAITLVVAGISLFLPKKNDIFHDPKNFTNGQYTGPADQTKIPYSNGFYSGPYNPNLPTIDPTAPAKEK